MKSTKHPIIFLDLDGVLNTAEHRKSQQRNTGTCSRRNWCPTACHNLWWICRHLDARIVVSSSWRHNNTLSALKKTFASNGIPAQYVIDMTPDIAKLEEVWSKPIKESYCRGYEIEEWILLNDPDCSYIIIDDDTDMIAKQKARFVHVDSEIGFADQQAFNKAINLLNHECKQRTKP